MTDPTHPSAQGPGAIDPAATQPTGSRIIDENTDLSTLTDQEIMQLTEGMDHQDVQLDKASELPASTLDSVC
jgi:ubiquitin thioesterase protein OTUB1